MIVWPARAATAIVLGLAVSPILGAVPMAAAAGSPAPVSVTMVVPLSLPGRTTALVDAEQLASYTSEFGLLTRQLDQVINRPVVLGIDPAIIASIRVLGTAAPESAVAWLSRLEGASNQTFPLAWADADLTVGLQAGSTVPLLPESLDFAIDPSLFEPPADEEPAESASPAPSPSPTPTTTPEADDGQSPALPTSESLTAWNYTVDEIAWPAMNSVTAADLAVLSPQFPAIILSSANLDDPGLHRAHARLGESSVLVSDASLSSQFGATVQAGSGLDWSAAMAAFAAAVAAVPSTTESPASVLVTLDRGVPMSDPDLGITIDSLAVTGGVQLTGIAAALALEPATDVTLTDAPQDPARIAAVAEMLALEAEEGAFAQIAADPSLITSERRLELLAVLSNSWADLPDTWLTAVGDFTTASTELRDSVKVVKSSAITLWADRASLPVIVSNDLDQAVTVYITVRPLSPLLKVENSFVKLTVEPDSQRKGQVPVQSLSNGTVELEISLHGQNGREIGTTTFVRTTVQAGWETPFTVGIGIVVVLVFAFGIVRTIIRRRRASASED